MFHILLPLLHTYRSMDCMNMSMYVCKRYRILISPLHSPIEYLPYLQWISNHQHKLSGHVSVDPCTSATVLTQSEKMKQPALHLKHGQFPATC